MKKIIFIGFFLFFCSFFVSAQDIRELKEKEETGSSLMFHSGKSLTGNKDNYDVKAYFLSVEMDNVSVNIKGSGEMLCEVVSDSIAEFEADLATNLQVDSVWVDGQPNGFTRPEDLIVIPLQPSLTGGTLFRVRIFYHGVVTTGSFFSGMTSKEDNNWHQWVTYTLSEPFSARNWFPCKQDLRDKADSVKVSVTVPDSLMAGSNGILKSIDTLPGKKLRFNWESHYPIDYYLISATVANYRDYSIYAHPEGMKDSILIQNFIYNDPLFLAAYKTVIDETSSLMNLYSVLFGLYPFSDEKYGHCVAPMGGGMEHQTMTTLSTFNFTLTSHEMAHQWFGDHVTCAAWQDIWINEGFASYVEYLALQKLKTQADADNWMDNAHANALKEPSGSVYVPFEDAGDIYRIFNGNLSYKKGASIIQMIRFELNDDTLFFKTLKEFQKRFAGSVATGLDFKQVLEDVSGKDFTGFFDQWYFGQGYPAYEITWGSGNDSLWIHLVQTPSSAITPLFKMPLEFRVGLGDRDTLIRIFQNKADQVFKVYITGGIVDLEVDPHKWSLFKLNSFLHVEDMQQQGMNKVFLYPNPAGTRLIVDFRGHRAERVVSLINISGKKVMEIKTNETQLPLQINRLAGGMYLIRVTENGQQVWTGKWVKTK